MSNTKRRKHCKVPKWAISKYVPIIPECKKFCVYKSVQLTGKELKIKINKFHSDTGSRYGWNGSAPADFRKLRNRNLRAKNKNTMRNINKKCDYEEYEFKLFVKDAGWYYW